MRKHVLSEASLHNILESKIPLLKKIMSDNEGPTALHALLEGMHPSEVAYLIQYLEAPDRANFIQWLKPNLDPDIFLGLAHNVLTDIVTLLSPEEIVSIILVLENDNAASLLHSLDESQEAKVLDLLPEKKRNALLQRLRYPERSAGRLMQEVPSFSKSWSVGKCVRFIHDSSILPENFCDIFVVDEHHRPIGTVPLVRVLQADDTRVITEIMNPEVRLLPAQWDQEEVAFTFRLYNLMSAPVVDEKNELLGMITADDVIDMVDREATEDLLRMGGVGSSDFYESVLKTSFSRINWLVVTLINTFLTSMVINAFQQTLQAKVTLTILMPVAAAMGGNSGIQTSTIIIRALTTKELGYTNLFRTFIKEIQVNLLNGSILGLILGGLVYLWFHDFPFAMVLGSAVVFNMLWAGIAGTALPVILSHLGHDPAVSTGSLLTTTTDVLGYMVFLGLATWIMV